MPNALQELAPAELAMRFPFSACRQLRALAEHIRYPGIFTACIKRVHRPFALIARRPRRPARAAPLPARSRRVGRAPVPAPRVSHRPDPLHALRPGEAREVDLRRLQSDSPRRRSPDASAQPWRSQPGAARPCRTSGCCGRRSAAGAGGALPSTAPPARTSGRRRPGCRRRAVRVALRERRADRGGQAVAEPFAAGAAEVARLVAASASSRRGQPPSSPLASWQPRPEGRAERGGEVGGRDRPGGARAAARSRSAARSAACARGQRVAAARRRPLGGGVGIVRRARAASVER